MLSFNGVEKKGKNLLARFRMLQASNRARKEDELRRAEFLQELRLAQGDLEAARNNYNFAGDAGLLEYYIYEIKAAETRVNYYLKLARKEHFRYEPALFPEQKLAGGDESV